MIALLVSLGGPSAWMRLSFIGSAMYEMMAAGFGTQAVGVTLGKDPMTGIAFANAVWTMTLGAVEPISYFPIIGVVETYMAFVSGNISNLRIPA